ncbi:MAG TPA: hypothetical protein VH682_31810 [Gemmataceae bacterium]|jgi:hypothetical protein
MLDKLSRIKAIGFILWGSWNLSEGKLDYDLKDRKASNVLYAIVVAEEVVYIGETGNPLHERIDCYKNATKSTNLKVKKTILEGLGEGKRAEIFVLVDNIYFRYGECHLVLKAGVDNELIRGENLPQIVVPVTRRLLELILILDIKPLLNEESKRK